MSQVTVLKEGKHTGANNHTSKSETTSGISAPKESYWVGDSVGEVREGFLVEVMLELASEG